MVEFALIFPLLMMLILGTMDFGNMINRDSLIASAAKSGAREGAVNPKSADIEAVVRSSLSGFKQTDLVVTTTCRKPDNTACAGFDADARPGGVVVVKVDFVYKWYSFIPKSIGLGTTKTLSKTVEMRIE